VTMLREIRVYGKLAKFLKRRVFKAAVATPAEAVRFLLANFPQLEAHMADQHYKVIVASHELEAGDHPEQLHDPIGATETIKLVPVMAGAGAVGRIIAGVALVAAAIFIPGLGLGLAGATVTQIGILGGALILGGIAQLLTPTPQISMGSNGDDDPRKSYSFSGIQNVSRQGVPVPIVYGETIVGSVTIAAGIITQEITE
jgi:predicted phage tail protein